MFQFIGYSAFSGPDCLTCSPGQIDNITTTKISNAIFDHLNITRNTDLSFSTNIPSAWDFDTIMDADFENNINAGNVDFLIEQISAIKIKRRIKGSFNWITFTTIPINQPEDLQFLYIDRFNTDGVEYEYAFVPIMGDITNGVEGNYIINSILSKLTGVFIGDANQTFRFLYDVQYGTNARNQQIGIFEPLGRKYPMIVANGLLSYESGIVSATLINNDFQETGAIDKNAILELKNNVKDFLTNKKPKLLRDWNGNNWLCIISSSPQINYKVGSGMRIPQISFNWTEIGDSNSQTDLYYNGLIEEVD